MQGQECTPEEMRRRSASCQRQRQKLLRTAVENSTSRWVQQVFSTRCSLPALTHLWRQQTGGSGDFDNFAQRVIRRSRSRLRSPSETSVGSSRRSASEPRHWMPVQGIALPAAQGKRRHSIAVHVLPAAYCGPYVCVAPAVSEPTARGAIRADKMLQSRGHQLQQDYSGVRAADGMQQVCLVPHAVPVLLFCGVGMTPENHFRAQSASAPGQGTASRGERADKWTQTEVPYSPDYEDQLQGSPRGHVAQTASSKFMPSRAHALPGNFAELEKSWDFSAGSSTKLTSKHIRF